MLHSSSIERLGWSEVIVYRLSPSIHQSSELIQLGAGDLKGSLEVDPLDHLKAAGGGQAASVCAVSGARSGHHGVNEGL